MHVYFIYLFKGKKHYKQKGLKRGFPKISRKKKCITNID